jgi:hypothetical protein
MKTKNKAILLKELIITLKKKRADEQELVKINFMKSPKV